MPVCTAMERNRNAGTAWRANSSVCVSVCGTEKGSSMVHTLSETAMHRMTTQQYTVAWPIASGGFLAGLAPEEQGR